METFSRGTQLDPWYVTGLVDGEGCFTYSRSGKQMGLYFAVKTTGSDQALLERLKQFFGGAGHIYRVVARAPRAKSGWNKTASYYRITKNSDLLTVMAHFDNFPLVSSKAQSYAIWREMVLVKSAFRNHDREKLESLAKELSACSARNQQWR